MRIHSRNIGWSVIGTLFAFSVVLLATPGANFIYNYFTRGSSVTNRIHEKAFAALPKPSDSSRPKHWSLQLHVEGDTDFVHQDVALAPGGFSGWHSHPGPVFITIKTGTATWYNAQNPNCEPIVYPAGSSFIEPANVSHYVTNEGSTDLELLAFYLVPKGMATRQEQPQPSQCPF
ncbi:MAG TPA: cupin domain-containing protein [Bryobacteraceae bacterium]|nr:cupin domain-containing protein [Bryobacteraceae bacterium]